MFSLKNVRFLPARRSGPKPFPRVPAATVYSGRFADIVRRVTAAGERMRAERAARKVVPMTEYRHRASSAIPDSE